ncbi:TRAP transporter small permease [Ahrensia kielensis]|uniref:TRAP transporter small permease protein n=1 Tax=Ahrensia kielensis TaxID=76980 RepID=A0ABU9T3R5_9HYPH
MMSKRVSMSNRMSRFLNGGLDIVTVSLTFTIIAVTLAQVFSRYVLSSSLVWSDELNRLLFVWLIAITAASANHMRIEFFVGSLRRRIRRALGVFALAVSLACLGVLAYGAQSLWMLLRFDTYTRLPVSPGLLFLAVFIGVALWAMFLIARCIIQAGDIEEFSSNTEDES